MAQGEQTLEGQERRVKGERRETREEKEG